MPPDPFTSASPPSSEPMAPSPSASSLAESVRTVQPSGTSPTASPAGPAPAPATSTTSPPPFPTHSGQPSPPRPAPTARAEDPSPSPPPGDSSSTLHPSSAEHGRDLAPSSSEAGPPTHRRVSPRRSHPHLPHSTDSLLHHLHHDPSASHITLSNQGAPVVAHQFQHGVSASASVSAAKGKGKEKEGDVATVEGLLDIGSSPPSGLSPATRPGASLSGSGSETGESRGVLVGGSGSVTVRPHKRVKSQGIGLMGKPLDVLPPSPQEIGPPTGDLSGAMHRAQTHGALLDPGTPAGSSPTLKPQSHTVTSRPSAISLPSHGSGTTASSGSTPSPMGESSEASSSGTARDKALANRGKMMQPVAPRLRTRTGNHPPHARVSTRPTTAPSGSQGMLKNILPVQGQAASPLGPEAGSDAAGTRVLLAEPASVEDGSMRGEQVSIGAGIPESSAMAMAMGHHGGATPSSGMLSSQSDSSASDYFDLQRPDQYLERQPMMVYESGESTKWPAEGDSPYGESLAQFDDVQIPATTPSVLPGDTPTGPPRQVGNTPWPGFLSPAFQNQLPGAMAAQDAAYRPSGESPDLASSPDPGDRRRSTLTPTSVLLNRGMTLSPTAMAPQAMQGGDEDLSCVDVFSQQMSQLVEQGLAGTGTVTGTVLASPTQPGAPTLVAMAGSLEHPPPKAAKRFLAASSLGQSESADWRSFIQAYSEGRWDSAKIPQAPRVTSPQGGPVPQRQAHAGSLSGHQYTAVTGSQYRGETSPLGSIHPEKEGGPFGLAAYLANKPGMKEPPARQVSSSSTASSLDSGPSSGSTGISNSSSAPTSVVSSHPPPVPVIQQSLHVRGASGEMGRRKTVDESANSVAASRNFIAPSSAPATDGGSMPTFPTMRTGGASKRNGPGHIALDSVAAATVRLASQGFSNADFAPLGMPSPERELLDPMAGALTPEQGQKQRKASSSSDSAVRPGSWLREDSASLKPPRQLPPIAASPVSSPSAEHPPSRALVEAAVGGNTPRLPTASGDVGVKRIPAASAPLDWSASGASASGGDYFGAAAPDSGVPGTTHEPDRLRRRSQSRPTPDVSDSDGEENGLSARRESASKPKLTAHSSHGATSSSGHTTKAVFHSHEAPASLSNMHSKEKDPVLLPLGSHEESFGDLKYLVPPMPPNEAERRKALYRFNIMHTAQDASFDRIAHLTKLVFNCKIVLMSLIDEKEQWHKVDHGLGISAIPRENSFCGHAILARNDEPMIINDTLQDWRFASNPHVVGYPFIRFYAGAPLRTSDGHNIGSLCVIDTQPRAEFPPRSRMILKEFAAIAVREMELWRDKTRLRARDRIQTSMEKFTRECLELDSTAETSPANAAAKMERVYQRAAKLVRRTLDVDGALVLDLSQFESVETVDSDGTISKAYQADPYEVDALVDENRPETYKANVGGEFSYVDRKFTFGPLPPWIVMGASESAKIPVPKDRGRGAVGREHAKFSEFLTANPEGRIYEHVVPSWIRHVLPSGLQYAMVVPIFNIDKHPFALLCAYTCSKTKQFLEGFELQFLRAIGVVILSAVLKRRMVLADKAKSNFISNISHELRTPLHGILAAAELLADTHLDSNQVAFLQTVQACGNSLIETVNHVLDFTKLSGATKHAMENTIRPGSVNLAKLVEETVEGCWIGQRAKSLQAASEIGSFYSPPTALNSGMRRGSAPGTPHVETVIDIGLREKGWQVFCEKGGIRRVLMNLIGNSLKFTSDGYVQVALRELAHTPGSKIIPIEMAVIDTGKGISRNFLKEQLFHPFSQENPLQTGTGLGLAIVNSIVRSDSVNGKVDVWSSEGLGTEIKVTLNVEVEDSPVEEDRFSQATSQSSGDTLFGLNHTISLLDFRQDHRGANLNRELIAGYASWWGFEVAAEDSSSLGDIIFTDEDDSILDQLIADKNIGTPVLILSTSRSARQSPAFSAFVAAGGFAQMVFKPAGPGRVEQALRACMRALQHDTPSQATSRSVRSDYFSPRVSPMHPARSPAFSDLSISQRQSLARQYSNLSASSRPDPVRPSSSRQVSGSSTFSGGGDLPTPLSGLQRQLSAVYNESNTPGQLLRRRSEEDRTGRGAAKRPPMAPRSTTYQDSSARGHSHSHSFDPRRGSAGESEDGLSTPGSPNSAFSTISLADGGVMLKHAALPPDLPRPERTPRIMLVDDNAINLQLLGAYLKKKNIPYQQATNGQISVDLFLNSPAGHWDIILMDISMPVMDGFEATRAIRKIESDRRRSAQKGKGGSPSLGGPTTPTASTKVSPILPGSVQSPVTAVTKIFALSGRATSEDKKQAFGAGVDGYLVKPVRLASLQSLFGKLGF